MSKDNGINNMPKQDEINDLSAITANVPLENSELSNEAAALPTDVYGLSAPAVCRSSTVEGPEKEMDLVSESQPQPQQNEDLHNQQPEPTPSTSNCPHFSMTNSPGYQSLLESFRSNFYMTQPVKSGIPIPTPFPPPYPYPYLQPYPPTASAANYINNMREFFYTRDQGQSANYIEFLDILRTLTYEHTQVNDRQPWPSTILTDIDRAEINSRVAKLFENQPLGLQEFQRFLPAAAEHQTTERLQVEDALNYLDQVKYHFRTQPDRYNLFLDVMKEFKTHSISTSAVMQSVSNLFVGYPELIQGFNLFLPPGHKIEHEAGDQVLVRDGQPTVTYRYRGSESLSGLLEDENVSDDQGNGSPQHSNQDSTLQANTSDSTEGWDIPVITIPDSEEPEYPEGELVVDEDSQLQEDWNLQQQTPESPTNSLLPTHADERFTRNVDGTVLAMNPLIVDGFPVVHAKDPVEFGSAVSLVQTIKERFQAAGQPEKYTEFLAIISESKKRHQQLVQGQELSYEDRQRENQEVYSQVSKLLENNDDLLRSFEYHLSLPSSTNLQKPDHNLEHGTPNNSQLSPICKPGDVERKRNVKLKRAKPPKNVVGFVPRTTQHRGPRVQGPKAKPPVRPVPKPQAIGAKRPGRPPDTLMISAKRQKPKPKTADLMTKEVKRMIAEMRREPTFTPEQRFKNANGMIFFSKARESLDSREAYNQFMHYLNLYMYEIISKYEFVKMVSSFVVKHPDLLKWLEDFLGIKKIVDYSVPPPPAEQVVNPQYDDVTGAQILDFDILTCKKYGPSYYVLPEGLPLPRCSGRTKLCNEVLNDTLVSSPTNYSNDEYTPVTSSKETQFDDDINETLTRIEDERFELDLVIEPNLTTMIHFEAMVRGMKRMTMKELKGFRLNDSLGGTSPIIYMNAIGRLYGNHAGSIIDAIKNNPRVAVPAVLRRIKDKSDEWRDEQRNFNIDWREQSSGKADLSEELALREVGTKRMKTTDED